MNDNVVDHLEIHDKGIIHDKDADLKRRGVSQSPGGVLIKKLHILRSVIGTIFPVEACIMSGHYGSLIADNRSRCALSAVRSITGRAGDFQIYRVALYCIASHRTASRRRIVSARANSGSMPLASLIIEPAGVFRAMKRAR